MLTVRVRRVWLWMGGDGMGGGMGADRIVWYLVETETGGDVLFGFW